MLMTAEECPWLDYVIYNDDGDVIGFKPNTPDEIKSAYDDFIKGYRK